MEAARELAPSGMEIEPFSLRAVPFYDGDLEAQGDPDRVRALKAAIRDADGLVIVTPEYNRGLPAVTKNAIDWASRPPFDSVLTGKPVLLMGATTGRSATEHALQQAAEALAHSQAVPFEQRFGVARANQLVDPTGRFQDRTMRDGLRDVLINFERSVRSTVAPVDKARAAA
jgi:chromate reductase